MIDDLLQAIEASETVQADKLFMEEMTKGSDAWEIHLSLFPLVQQVLNPPFINPHLPKMYRIYRELIPYLKKDEIPAFIHLEIMEVARRPKLGKLQKANLLTSTVSFSDIESSRSQKRKFGFRRLRPLSFFFLSLPNLFSIIALPIRGHPM